MTTLVPYHPLAVQQRLAWRTGVLKTYSGLESRICYRKNPRESLSVLYAVDLELDRRDLRLALFDDPVSAWNVPLKPYGVPSQDDVTIGSVTIDSTYADWVVANQKVYVEGDDPEDEDSAFLTTITGVGGTTSSRVLVLADAPPVGGVFSAGLTRVTPVYGVLLEDAQATARAAPAGSAVEAALRDVGAGTWQMQGTLAAYRTTWGTGSPALTTHGGYYVMDRRPVVEADPEEQFLTELRRFDLGGLVTQQWSKASSDIRRSHLLQMTGDAERQWLIKFLTTVYGPQVAFLLPTWQPDLDLVAQPSAPYTSLRVYRTPGYQTWFASLAHKHLQLLKEDGTVVYTTATAVVNNMDGTETITVGAVGAGPFERVSLLELARVADDVVDLLHVGDRVETELRALVVQR